MVQDASEHPLRKWRKAKGLTLQQCADAVGTSRMVWSDWERSRRRPNGHFMPKVREVTEGEVSADDFFPSCNQAA
jgi:transcriptional regulator with XRE-family HTH domain